MDTCVVPDLHGHWERLQTALSAAGKRRLIFLGDLLDDSPRRRNARGDYRPAGEPDAARAVLRTVRELHAAGRAQVVLGNHEVMAIAGVLDGHAGLFDVWWRHGGRETAASYGWRGVGEAGELANDLHWLREEGRLWQTVGPSGQQTLIAHATRPAPERVLSGQNRYADLLNAESDEVVWFPLGLPDEPETHRLAPLPPGYVRSLHGHMETNQPTILTDEDGREARQLDLHPRLNTLALAQLNEQGSLRVVRKRVR